MEQVPRGLSTGQVEKAQPSSFSPAVCMDRLLNSASKKKKFFLNQSGEAGNLARKLG